MKSKFYQLQDWYVTKYLQNQIQYFLNEFKGQIFGNQIMVRLSKMMKMMQLYKQIKFVYGRIHEKLKKYFFNMTCSYSGYLHIQRICWFLLMFWCLDVILARSEFQLI